MFNNKFIRKIYKEENFIYYMHFYGEYVIRQMEILPDKVVKLTENQLICGTFFLYD